MFTSKLNKSCNFSLWKSEFNGSVRNEFFLRVQDRLWLCFADLCSVTPAVLKQRLRCVSHLLNNNHCLLIPKELHLNCISGKRSILVNVSLSTFPVVVAWHYMNYLCLREVHISLTTDPTLGLHVKFIGSFLL